MSPAAPAVWDGTLRLVARYIAYNWDAATGLWKDFTSNTLHAQLVGAVQQSYELKPGGGTNDYVWLLSGGTGAKIVFPPGVLPPTYTLFHVARYNGPARGRIVTTDLATGGNWLSGKRAHPEPEEGGAAAQHTRSGAAAWGGVPRHLVSWPWRCGHGTASAAL